MSNIQQNSLDMYFIMNAGTFEKYFGGKKEKKEEIEEKRVKTGQ